MKKKQWDTSLYNNSELYAFSHNKGHIHDIHTCHLSALDSVLGSIAIRQIQHIFRKFNLVILLFVDIYRAVRCC